MNKRASLDKQDHTVGKKRRILVVDGSRVIRATLTKHLGDSFEIVEEGNGESAWQTLMLDGKIEAVISGISPPKLEASDLLARIRGSAVRRVREVAFVPIVSDLEGQQPGTHPDGWPGATGFISKSMSKAAMVQELSRLLDAADPALRTAEVKPAIHAAGPAAKLLSQADFRAVVSSIAISGATDQQVCMLVFGIDHLDDLISRFGKDVPEMLTSRIAGLLAAKVDPHDQFGYGEGKHLAIISRGVDIRQGTRFAKRVCKSLASGQITIHGKKVKLTASVGIASTSEDKVPSGKELLLLAEQRLAQALVCGGNTVCSELRPDCPMQCRDKGLAILLKALQSGADTIPPDQVGPLGVKVLPLLKILDRELALGLPLDEIQSRLAHHPGSGTDCSAA